MNNALNEIQSLSVSGELTILGLVMIFVCFVLLIVVIALLSSMRKDKKKQEIQNELPNLKIPVAEVQDTELLAVLTAAVAAAMEKEGNQSPFIIRSYKRTNSSSAWNKAGRDSQITNW